jgi:hypothetical protein
MRQSGVPFYEQGVVKIFDELSRKL